jgi:hypothetical protein
MIFLGDGILYSRITAASAVVRLWPPFEYDPTRAQPSATHLSMSSSLNLCTSKQRFADLKIPTSGFSIIHISMAK